MTMKLKLAMLGAMVGAFLIVPAARGDSLIPKGVLAQDLTHGAVLPLAGGVAQQLAGIMLFEQTQVSYGGMESLLLSIQSVDRAISIYDYPGGPLTITSAAAEPIVWDQARTPINPDATVTLDPASIDFGEVPVSDPVMTPEPSMWWMMLTGLAAFAAWLLLPRMSERAVCALERTC